MSFTDHIGQVIHVVIPKILHETELCPVKLVGVDAGGIWIESQMFTNFILSGLGKATSSKTMILFVPYGLISYAVISKDELALNERAFGA